MKVKTFMCTYIYAKEGDENNKDLHNNLTVENVIPLHTLTQHSENRKSHHFQFNENYYLYLG